MEFVLGGKLSIKNRAAFFSWKGSDARKGIEITELMFSYLPTAMKIYALVHNLVK